MNKIWLFSGIIIFVIILAIGYSAYGYFSFYNKKNQCIDKIHNMPIKTSIYISQNTNENDIIALETKLKQIEKMNVVLQSPEEIKEDFIRNHSQNKLILDSLQELKESPFSYTFQISFNYKDADIVVPQINKFIEENEFKLDKALGADIAFSEKKRLLDSFSKLSFFDKPTEYLKLGANDKFWKSYCGI